MVIFVFAKFANGKEESSLSVEWVKVHSKGFPRSINYAIPRGIDVTAISSHRDTNNHQGETSCAGIHCLYHFWLLRFC